MDDLILDLMARNPDRHVEIRKEVDPEAVGRAVAAFLNTDGGTLLLGVDPRGKLVGIADPDRQIENLQSHLNQSISPNASWSISPEIEGGKSCILVQVPRGATPPYLYDDRIYIRRGSEAEPASPMEITELISRRYRESARWERAPAPGVEIEHLDPEEIQRTIEKMRDRQMDLEGKLDDSRAALESLNLAEGGQILNGAVVLFGRAPARIYPQTRVRVARFADEEQTRFLDNRVLEGNLFTLIPQIERFLETNLPVASELRPGEFRREDKPAYPRFVLREGLMNALVHRDYTAFDGGVSVALFPDRLEIWNSGKLPDDLPPEELSSSGVSRPRNPDIAHVAFLRGLIERWGIGTRRIAQECRDAGLPEPVWLEVGGGVRLIVRLRETEAEETRGALLPERAELFLTELPAGQSIDAERYRRRFAPEVSDRTARRDLNSLVRDGYLELRRRGGTNIYVRTAKPIR